MEYIPTIGLEIHAELKTATKMFCNSKNDPDEKRPNVNICPVCMAHPGTLPVINKEAVRHILRIGKALGGAIADFTEFDRKNYFYPDIPKGYQISQYEYPLVKGGFLQIPIFSTQSEDKNSQFLISNSPNKNSKFKKIAITRVHLEEDTARSQHDKGDDASFVDFNRAGVPLMELVTEPVISSAKEAGAFARELQLLLRYLGASEANMEKGEMRVEANISVSKDDTRGTKVEVKNINSFRAVERAIEYEIKRQSEALENGEKIRQETRGWNDVKQETFSQRVKEGAADYRYF
ncbi:MAG: Asp-tRNA(Asn)/Glu-tRNA(Gln) amidotransferase subunit GatB, partial [Parcubacteria group bacterium]|nr:Asp-tRNA(Asn)/Glu-tRNA(Gln) amidotransferase subunit GatB [Parcubacteria group bacterium]